MNETLKRAKIYIDIKVICIVNYNKYNCTILYSFFETLRAGCSLIEYQSKEKRIRNFVNDLIQ